ncbi:hypothetical protein Z517_08000 [Fonsecaea pedrosoi CBS 271.37]|uniref:Uncharacterized protein n=1 Tax=Fonsecaea pedrosoi CBS 271.37 TaxID=1442368 RepID=A0A0D2EVA9_9EURO|nr:uncharacterized protein Z517_08000 [Fonsecaea pedrosoi CBS 271.37]KIW78167.1 hypothetical protein Z517_08000 [Fonsecaea pedrosoi CBS 271.37]
MAIGRPRIPGTEAERAEARRSKVRANVQAFRRRQKEKQIAEQACRLQAREDSVAQKHKSLACHQPTIDANAYSCPKACDASLFPVEDAEFWLWAIPSEMGARLVGSIYHVAFVQDLKNRFVTLRTLRERANNRAGQRLSICCSTWVTTVTLEMDRPETEVLMEALLAASLAKVGKDRSEPDMVLQGAYMQTRALQRLRCSLKGYQEGDREISPTVLSSTALICAMSELIANKSWDNFNCHLLGVGALIFHGGTEGLTQQSSQEHFYGYRALQTPFLFMSRQQTFLSEPQWIDFPWKEGVELARQPLHSMLDIALKVLPEIVKQESAKSWSLSCLKARYETAFAIVEELNGWERQLQSQQERSLYTKVMASWGGVFQRRLHFPNSSIALAFAMYTAVRVHVAMLVTNISEEMASHASTTDMDRSSAALEALRWARLACQSLEYFHTSESKVSGLIDTLWPLESAWELFSKLEGEGFVDVSQEIVWCRSAAEQYVKLGIPPFRWR